MNQFEIRMYEYILKKKIDKNTIKMHNFLLPPFLDELVNLFFWQR